MDKRDLFLLVNLVFSGLVLVGQFGQRDRSRDGIKHRKKRSLEGAKDGNGQQINVEFDLALVW